MNFFRSFKKQFKSTHNVQRYFSTQVDDISKTTWDIIISGGGMVGCSLAASLGSSAVLAKKKILLLESNPKTDYIINPSYSNRVCALNNGTRLLFEGFDAWKHIQQTRLKEVRKMVVWESCSDARISFQQDDVQDKIAYIIENDVILYSLWKVLNEQLPGRVDILRGSKAVNYTLPSNDTDLVTVDLQNGVPLKTKLLIGADGVNSLVRDKMNVKCISWSYNQKGIVATLKLSEPTENIVAWQRFLCTGPIALLPLSDDLCSLVWTVPHPMCEKLLAMPDEQFVDALNSALWNEEDKNTVVESALSSVRNAMSTLMPGNESVRQLPPSILSVLPSSRAAFPLGLGHATEYVAPKVALVGDAAHRVHPLAGQGVNLGFGDVKCLTECIEKSVYNGDSIGSLQYLLEYETNRQRHVVPTMFSIDALNRLYKTDLTPFVFLRSLGLTVLDACGPLKTKIMHHASS